MPYHLYYAGMADDGITEQIGLAISTDGLRFERIGDQPIIAADPARRWKNLRTCNPTVLQEPGGFRMFYQGISAERTVAIASAISSDGIRWTCAEEPVLTTESAGAALRSVEFGTYDVIEPAVLKESGEYRMWFVTRGSREPNNRLHHARSRDGVSWHVDHADLMSGKDFGKRCKIFYPQIVPVAGGYRVDVSVRHANGHFVVHTCHSVDGLSMGPWRDLVPGQFQPSLIDKVLRRVGLGRRRYALGLAHSHIVPGEPWRTYFHAYHLNGAGRIFMNVVALLDDADRPVSVFEPARDPGAWDSFFVADPFVLNVTGPT